jgi:hypothetical protein
MIASEMGRMQMPKRRYLVTLARDLLGSFPDDGPLVFVSDGGHYENLGLVDDAGRP